MTTKRNPQRRGKAASRAKGNEQHNDSVTAALLQARLDGGRYRPETTDGYKVIGAELDDTPCSHCGKADGNVLLIRNPQNVRNSEPLHEHCAPLWFHKQESQEEPQPEPEPEPVAG